MLDCNFFPIHFSACYPVPDQENAHSKTLSIQRLNDFLKFHRIESHENCRVQLYRTLSQFQSIIVDAPLTECTSNFFNELRFFPIKYQEIILTNTDEKTKQLFGIIRSEFYLDAKLKFCVSENKDCLDFSRLIKEKTAFDLVIFYKIITSFTSILIDHLDEDLLKFLIDHKVQFNSITVTKNLNVDPNLFKKFIEIQKNLDFSHSILNLQPCDLKEL